MERVEPFFFLKNMFSWDTLVCNLSGRHACKKSKFLKMKGIHEYMNIRVSHENIFFKKKMAQPAPQVFGGCFEGIQKDF